MNVRAINVHLTVDEHTLAFCREVNRRIREVTASEIVFGAGSRMMPHVTLVMGDLAHPQPRREISRNALNTLTSMTNDLTAMRLPLARPRPAEDPDGRYNGYVISEVEVDDKLSLLQKFRLREPYWKGRAHRVS